MGNRIDTQTRLIAATRRIIIDEGVEATSLEHICKAAGFSRGAFYSNFASKDSLLAALAEDEYAALIERLRRTVDSWAGIESEGASAGAGGASSASPSGDASAGVPLPIDEAGSGPSDERGEENGLLMESLLFEALDAIGVDADLYLLHSELQMRSIRDPEWATRFLDINLEFVDELGRVLQWILEAAGRELVSPLRPLTHSVIGVVMRAAGIAAWRTKAVAVLGEGIDPHAPADAADRSERVEAGPVSARDSAAREILEVVLQILYASSRPRP